MGCLQLLLARDFENPMPMGLVIGYQGKGTGVFQMNRTASHMRLGFYGLCSGREMKNGSSSLVDFRSRYLIFNSVRVVPNTFSAWRRLTCPLSYSRPSG